MPLLCYHIPIAIIIVRGGGDVALSCHHHRHPTLTILAEMVVGGEDCCRAGWLTVRTTVLCSRFNSLTLSPSVPYHYPQAYCTIIGLHHIALGCITSHHIVLGRIALHRVTLHRVRSVALLSGQLHHYRPYLVHYPSLLLFLFLHALFLLFL